MADSGMRAKQSDSLLPSLRSWLKDMHMDAADALVTLVTQFDPEWDPADCHEDMRETLQPYFDNLEALVQRHERLRAEMIRVRDLRGTWEQIAKGALVIASHATGGATSLGAEWTQEREGASGG